MSLPPLGLGNTREEWEELRARCGRWLQGDIL